MVGQVLFWTEKKMGRRLFLQVKLMGQLLFLNEKCGFYIFSGSISQGGKHIFSGKNNGATGFLRSKNDGAETFFDSKIFENPAPYPDKF